MIRSWWVAGVALLLASACSSSGSSSGTSTGGSSGSAGNSAICSPGDTRTCVGPGACQGGQSCGANGTWSACDCGGGGASGGGGTASGGTGGSPSGGGGGQAGTGPGGQAGAGGSGGSNCVPPTSTQQACDNYSYAKTGKLGQACGIIKDCAGNVHDCGGCGEFGGCGAASNHGTTPGAPNICSTPECWSLGTCGGSFDLVTCNSVRCKDKNGNFAPCQGVDPTSVDPTTYKNQTYWTSCSWQATENGWCCQHS